MGPTAPRKLNCAPGLMTCPLRLVAGWRMFLPLPLLMSGKNVVVRLADHNHIGKAGDAGDLRVDRSCDDLYARRGATAGREPIQVGRDGRGRTGGVDTEAVLACGKVDRLARRIPNDPRLDRGDADLSGDARHIGRHLGLIEGRFVCAVRLNSEDDPAAYLIGADRPVLGLPARRRGGGRRGPGHVDVGDHLPGPGNRVLGVLVTDLGLQRHEPAADLQIRCSTGLCQLVDDRRSHRHLV